MGPGSRIDDFGRRADGAVNGRCLQTVDVVVLAGGLGTRIRDTLGDTPKLLAPVGGATYLDFLLGWLAGFGARRVVLGLGHLADRVTAHLDAHPVEGIETLAMIEPEPLGTAGALRFVDGHVRTDPVMVMNGDSFTGADLCDFVAAHERSGALGTLLCAEVADTAAFGRLRLSDTGRVLEFLEKDPAHAGPGVINAGVYLFSAALRARIMGMEGPSLERDVFARLAPGTLNAAASGAPFVDIGAPRDLARAEEVLAPYLERVAREGEERRRGSVRPADAKGHER